MLKKVLSCMISVFIAAAILTLSIPISADESAISGSGTADDPYLIANEDQLQLIKDLPDSCFKLTDNIAVSTWSGIVFSGVLDGDGYKITINKSSNGFIYQNSGVIKNLSLDSDDDSGFPVLLVRNNYGTIENVHVSGSTESSKASYMGTVAVFNFESGIIKNTYSTADTSYLGSFASGSGKQCYGVFVGSNQGTIENCYWRGFCYQIEDFVGENTGTLTQCVLGGDFGKSDTALKLQATYPGWDFENTWKIDPDMNGGFPCLINEREFIKIPVEKISLDRDSLYIEPGESVQLNAEILPDTAWDKSIEWSSSDGSVSVSSDGIVTAISLGESIVTAKSVFGGLEASCYVYVVKRVNQINLGCTEKLIEKDERFSFDVSIQPEDATNQTIIWSSSDPLTVSVDNGTITGLKDGTVTITARSADGGATAECIVRVLKPAQERFDINGDGSCDRTDAEILSMYVQGHSGTGLTAEKADTNGDGIVTGRDVTAILQYLDSINGGNDI